MTKEQAKKVIEMVYKDKPIDKGGLFEIIDMIDEPSQYVPYLPNTSPPNDPFTYRPTITCSNTNPR